MTAKAAFFDIDGTLTDGLMGMAYCAFLTQGGVMRRENGEALARLLTDYQAGYIDYHGFLDSFGRHLSQGLAGRLQSEVIALGDAFYQAHRSMLFPYSAPLVALFSDAGYMTVAISGSPIEMILVLKEKVGFDRVFGTVCEVRDGRYTGSLLCNLGYQEEKRRTFDAFVAESEIELSACFAFGDTMEDLAFLEPVGTAIALNPSPQLHAVAEERGWPCLTAADDVLGAVARLLGGTGLP